MTRLTAIFILAPGLAVAAPYERPIPQAQSATAEFWFALASLALLYDAHRLVMRRWEPAGPRGA